MALNEREKLMELMASQQVVNAEFYNSLCQQNPMLSKLMWDKFKNFLEDDYFTDLERQTMLIKFFEEQTDLNLTEEILSHVQNCECKEDYTKIILEWAFHNSENIKQSNLAKVDGAALCNNKQRVKKLQKPADLTDEVMENILSLTLNMIVPPEN